MTGPFLNAILGITFFVVGTLATFLMYHLWGYPYDKKAHKSAAPESLMFLHRLLGYIYIGIYVYLMIQMVPRMWQYQIELPARTVVHLACGMMIGAILVVKIMIVRFFKHLEGPMIPFLGTMLWLCTCMVIFLSVPFTLRESYLNRQALPDSAARAETLDRVKTLLTSTGLEDNDLLADLSTTNGLAAGREVLFSSCTECHDLRTVLAKPRTASNWRSTVRRMADRSDLLTPITELEQWQVTAYLIAISPDLQSSARQKRKETVKSDATQKALETVSKPADDGGAGAAPGEPSAAPKNYTEAVARTLYKAKCSECHGLDDVENYAFSSRDDVVEIMERMARKDGFEANETQMSFLLHFLETEFVK